MPRILYLLHCYYNLAGTEEHTRMLTEGLSGDYSVFIAVPDRDRIVLISEGKEIFEAPAPRLPWPVAPYTSEPHERAFETIIETVKPDLIHIQHFIHWPLSILDRINALGIPTAISFHDYYPITPQFTMLGIDDPRVTLGPNYSKFHFGQDITPYLRERRAIIGNALAKIPIKITPSNFLAQLYEMVFPGPYTVINHGIRPFEVKKKKESPFIRFGCVGSLLPQKGYLRLLKAFEGVQKKFPDATLHMFGGGEGAEMNPQPGVVFYGTYRPTDISDILTTFDIGIIPSIFAETFCLVLSELWRARIPVAASRIGALPERIQDGVNGRLFAPGNVEEIQGVLEWFLTNDSWKKWEIPTVRLLDAMIDDYRNLYRKMTANKHCDEKGS